MGFIVMTTVMSIIALSLGFYAMLATERFSSWFFSKEKRRPAPSTVKSVAVGYVLFGLLFGVISLLAALGVIELSGS